MDSELVSSINSWTSWFTFLNHSASGEVWEICIVKEAPPGESWSMDYSSAKTVLEDRHVLPTSYSSHTKSVKYEYSTVVINFGSILESTEV